MVKVVVDKDEWYPVYSIVSYDYGGKTAEFTDEELARIEAAFAEFDAVQDLLSTRAGYR